MIDFQQCIDDEKVELNRTMRFLGACKSHKDNLYLRERATKCLNRLRYWEMIQSSYRTNYISWDDVEYVEDD